MTKELYIIIDANNNPIEITPVAYELTMDLEIKSIDTVKIYDNLEDAEFDLEMGESEVYRYDDIHAPFKIIKIKQHREIIE